MSYVTAQQNFNDGQGIDFADFNQVQQYAWAIRDLQIGCLGKTRMGDAFQTDSPIQNFLLAEHGSSGAISSGGNMIVNNDGGMIYQWTVDPSTADGTTPILLPYMLTAGELQSTVPTADPSNPRIDVLCVKLTQLADDSTSRDFKDETTGALSSQMMNIRNRVSIAKSYVTGTAASSPSVPAIPSGYAALYYLHVAAAYTSTFRSQDGNVSDARIPRRVKMGRVFATSAFFDSTNASATAPAVLGIYNQAINFPGTNSSGASAYFPLPIGPYARVLAVGVFNDGGPTTFPSHYFAAFIRFTYSGGVFTGSSIVGGNVTLAGSSNINQYLDLQQPLWGNGLTCPLVGEDFNFATKTFVAVNISCNNNSSSALNISHVDFIYAE